MMPDSFDSRPSPPRTRARAPSGREGLPGPFTRGDPEARRTMALALPMVFSVIS